MMIHTYTSDVCYHSLFCTVYKGTAIRCLCSYCHLFIRSMYIHTYIVNTSILMSSSPGHDKPPIYCSPCHHLGWTWYCYYCKYCSQYSACYCHFLVLDMILPFSLTSYCPRPVQDTIPPLTQHMLLRLTSPRHDTADCPGHDTAPNANCVTIIAVSRTWYCP
jgi:hypothetical protein